MRRILTLVPGGKRLLQIVWPFLAIVALLALVCNFSMDVMSAARAYVGGESLWSKAEKEAVIALNRYAATRSERDFRLYLLAIAVPLGDRRAREELEKPDPNLAIARQGFLDGRNDPGDIDGMIMLFRRFRNLTYMDRIIAIWSQADGQIHALQDAAQRLHALVLSGSRRTPTSCSRH